jgi:hypothetical protein
MEHTVACQNGHVKQIVVKTIMISIKMSAILSLKIEVHLSSLQLLFLDITHIFFNCCIVGAGEISGTQCVQTLPSCIIISVIYIPNTA